MMFWLIVLWVVVIWLCFTVPFLGGVLCLILMLLPKTEFDRRLEKMK
jgi:hypothetical protein